MRGDECRTGNVLFRRSIIAGQGAPFREELGTGGEDKDFFMRMERLGHIFRWCNEAVVYETVPPQRWTRQYVLQRALLRGYNNLKIPGQRTRLIAISLVAVPIYSILLPFALLAGQHVFMNYCVRFCDHAGRLMGLVGLSPANIR
jgi:cellulose synthase/poly-beta-1,6-N-acetylglucosamine synthase-like glycosyltransferase